MRGCEGWPTLFGGSGTRPAASRMPWPGFEPGRLAALPPQDSVSTSSTTRARRRKLGRGWVRIKAKPHTFGAMELWVAFAFGALVGTFVGVFVGRHRAAATRRAAPPVTPAPTPRTPLPAEVKHVVLDEGSANVLNALNNRLAAIGALADLLHGSPLDPERARALMMLHGEVRRAAEITQHFLELAEHPVGAAEPSDAA